MAQTVTISANVANSFLRATSENCRGIAVVMVAGASFGGGTVVLNCRPAGTAKTPTLLGSLATTTKDVFDIGAGMDILMTVAGATAPDATFYLSEIPG